LHNHHTTTTWLQAKKSPDFGPHFASGFLEDLRAPFFNAQHSLRTPQEHPLDRIVRVHSAWMPVPHSP
jgi:hypothetical protein